jgi:hypothetical protein
MDAQVRKTDQIGRQQLRAYIGVHALALKDLPVTGVASTGGIEIKNYGQTPAHDVQIGFMVAITRFPHDQKDVMPPFVDEPTDPKNGFVLDPTESRKAYHQIPAFDINETKAIADGRIAGTGNEVRLCMRGYVSYADVFGVDHVRLFCHFFGGPESKQPSYCMIHNTASQEELANILGNQRDK